MVGRILVVDDSPHFLQAAERLLAIRGLEPFALTHSRAEAISALDRGRPDGVLLDVNLAGEDGMSVARALSERQPAIPIVLMSSDALEVDSREIQRAGATAFVQKTDLATTDLKALFGLTE